MADSRRTTPSDQHDSYAELFYVQQSATQIMIEEQLRNDERNWREWDEWRAKRGLI